MVARPKSDRNSAKRRQPRRQKRWTSLRAEQLEPRTLLALAAQMVVDINPGVLDSHPYYLATAGNSLYFVAEDAMHGRELWKSDGTATGTMLLKDINPGTGRYGPSNLTNINGTIFFTACHLAAPAVSRRISPSRFRTTEG